MTLTDDDFVTNLSAAIRPNGVIYSITPISGFNGFSAFPRISEDKIEFIDLRIPQDEALSFEILHDGCLLENVAGLTKSLPKIRLRPLEPHDIGNTYFICLLAEAGLLYSTRNAQFLTDLRNIDLTAATWAVIYLIIFFAIFFIIPISLTAFLEKTGFAPWASYRIRNYSRSEALFSRLSPERDHRAQAQVEDHTVSAAAMLREASTEPDRS
ncbi:hypothetical protein [Neotabrizicola sp. sgz301269]|uniref:hypothetical protein n=1 Tax=Neotabrizicola sp. sgz301269 TaxID=3276282 RepID=UPI00376F5727